MKSEIVEIFSSDDYSKLDAPAKAIAKGELVAFPTETVYGLGANALLEDAVKNIFITKGRPQDNPLIVHVAEKSDIKNLVHNIPDTAKLIMDNLMPGPITLVLEKSDIVPDVVTAGGTTVAVRIPENEVARELISRAKVPVAAPSANISGKPSPTKARHVIEDLGDKLSYIIDGGSCRVGLESTVIDLTVFPPAILRPGGITHEQLESLIGEVVGYKAGDSDNSSPKSPGMKYKHYAPKAQMTVFEGDKCHSAILNEIKKYPDKKICVITAGNNNYIGTDCINCGKTPKDYSKNIFSALRYADEINADVVLAEFPFSREGIATALYNRIYKSCGGNVVLCK